jgi:predicted TIM-barrel fold metal-dependent hydrolase
VATVAPDAPDSELERLQRGGIRGLRLNFETQGVFDPKVAVERFQLASKRAAALGWHLQVNTRLPIVEAMEPHVLAGPATVVFDHFAQAEAARGVEQPGFDALVRLVKSGRFQRRTASRRSRLADAIPLAQALIAANRERSWGATSRTRMRGGRGAVRRTLRRRYRWTKAA